jgi:uncharacterized membrane protein YsdA (DUF1294 family)/cold shock CspA family protein
MRYLGRLHEWNDDKGFGFVTPNGGGTRAFVHIKAFERATRRPVLGDLLSYELTRDSKGRSNAAQVRFSAQAAAKPQRAGGRFPGMIVGSVSLVLFAATWCLRWVPAVVPLLYVAMSLITYLLYAMDKSAARHNQWRIQESTLHLFAFLGGWPGALFAQDQLRHKSVKAQFRFVFWITVALNLVALAWLLQSGKAEALNALP